MASIFSVQNLQTFLRRKIFPRPPGPPGPPGRRPGPPPGPPEGGPLWAAGAAGASGAFTWFSSDLLFPLYVLSGYRPAGAKAQMISQGRYGTSELVSRYKPSIQSAFALGAGWDGFCRRGFCWGRRGRNCGSRRGGRSRRFRAYLATGSAERFYLGQSLLFLVHAHGDELDHRLRDAQTALKLEDHGASGFFGHLDVIAVIKFADKVGQLAAAHLLDVLHYAATVGDAGREAGDQLVDVFVDRIGSNNEHYLIQTRHPCFLSPLRRQ